MSELAELHEEEALGKAYDGRLMRRLLSYIRPYKGRTALAMLLIVLSSLVQLVGPLATAVAIDLFVRPAVAGQPPAASAMVTGGEAAAGPADPVASAGDAGARLSPASEWVTAALAESGRTLTPEEGLAWTGGVFLASLLVSFLTLYAQGYVMQLMGQHIMYDLRRQIFRQLQRLPVSFFDRNPIGRLVTRATTDVDALNELFASGIVAIFGDLALLGGIVIVLFWMSWPLALVSFAILPLLLGLTFWFKLRARESYRTVRVRVARINAFLQEHLSGMAVVQLFNREGDSYDELAEINRDHRDANVQAIYYYAVYYPAVELITAVGMALIVWYGGGRVLAGGLSLGALVAFLQYAQRFYRPLADLSDKYNILQAAMASSERIFRLLDEPAGAESPPDPYRPEAVEGAVELVDVDFSYKPGEPVLQEVSLRVGAGETVAIVGHTGAGKSTLMNLLLRFYDVDAGSVRIDGVDVREWDLPQLRRSIAIVLQDVFLFSGTLARNIRLGDDEIDDERLAWAAREVNAQGFIERLPDGFETRVKERGAGISVGEKQLVSFARALAFDPRILILDEATSSVDTETEQKIQQALERLLVGRTSLVIAHRLSTIQRADRIVVLHKGRLREQGTHQELLAQRGIYYRLYQLQYRDQEAVA